MTTPEQESILTLALMAAFADGVNQDIERAEIKRIAESLQHAEVNPSALYQRVLLKQTTVGQAAAPLQSPELRQLAYEMAVGVCDADGAQTEAEKSFLTELRRELRLEEAATLHANRTAEQWAVEPLGDPTTQRECSSTPEEGQLEKTVMNYAILSGALELLPESLATMAIVPLQMKMVYQIGKSYGHELGRGHIKELLAAAGVGLTSQVLEGYARKLLGGVLGRAGGGWMQSLGNQATSSALSFATTWALGRLAQQYYAGGRKLSAIELRSTYESFVDQARACYSRYAGEIQQKAQSVNLSQLLPLIRG